jgi:hypothetical protein
MQERLHPPCVVGSDEQASQDDEFNLVGHGLRQVYHMA